MASLENKLLRPALREMAAYHVPSSAGLIKLDAMENPYPLPDKIKKEWLKRLANASLNRYPDSAAKELKAGIKTSFELPASSDILLGNGSDELIQLLCLAVLDAPARKSGRAIVMAPEPGFAMYRQTAIASGLDYIGVPLKKDDFSLDVTAMLRALDQYKPEILFLAYPNNPTGNLFDWEDCLQIVQNAPGLVVFDEAYHPFAESTAASLMKDFDQLLLLRTFSKFGLAGIRLGVLAGSACWLKHINKLRLPYNVNVLTQLTAELACEYYHVFIEQSKRIREQRTWLYEELTKLHGLQVYKSMANFILFRVEQGTSDRVFNNLLDRRILIKNMNKSHSLLKDCLRVTIGTEDENLNFLQALTQSINI